MPIIKDKKIGDYIIIKGRAGIYYFDKANNRYFIDSEMVASPNYDIAIYPESLVQIKNDDTINKVEYKKPFLERIEKLCKQGGIKSRFFLDQ